RSRVLTNGESIFDLRGRYATLPQHFAASGYRTMGAGKLFHGSSGKYAKFFQAYGPGSGNQGGPFTREELNTLQQNPMHSVDRGPGKLKAVLPMNGMPDVRRNGKSRNNSFDWGPVNVTAQEMPDGQVADWATRQLSNKSDQPFFMGVGFYRPHQPLFAPEKYFRPFPADQMVLPNVKEDDLDDMSDYAAKLARFPLTAGSHAVVKQYGQWDDAVAGYLACVHFIDELLGTVLDSLDESHYADDTWIILLSDHGYHLGQKEHWGKLTPWHESTRVPLIMVPPKGWQQEGFQAGMTIDRPVSLIDVYPTLVDICGLSSPKHRLDGQSLRALLDGPTTSQPRFAVTTVGRGTFSVVSDQHRYIRFFDGSEQLYDRESDPLEWNNRINDPELQSIRSRLRGQVPEMPQVAHYVRYREWKAVLYANSETPTELYSIQPGTGSGGGIGETRNVANDHPNVIKSIRAYLATHPTTTQCITIE
ncbi:MAG: sulfatase-like hydrolase/transferase, partial [Planctomycetota bacterium]